MLRRGLRFALLLVVAFTATTSLHAAELFPIYQNYQKAIAQGDAAAAKFYLSEGRREQLSKKSNDGALAEMDVLSPKKKLRLHKEIFDGDDATLIVTANVADNDSSGHINFVNEQGTWKILSELWNLGGGPDEEVSDEKVRQPENQAQRAALRKLREMGFPMPTANFLVMSAVEGNLEAVKLFIAAGYSPDTRDRDQPAIVSAAMFRKPHIVLYLIEAGADVNAVDDVNTTALMRLADQCDATETIRALLKAGATTDQKSAGGADAAMIAQGCPENLEAITAKK